MNLFDSLLLQHKSTVKLIGRGFRVTWSPTERKIFLRIGFSQKKCVPVPNSINVFVKNRYNFGLVSLDRSALNELTNKIRSLRPPNIYTGKGILINGEVVNKKVGKKTQY